MQEFYHRGVHSVPMQDIGRMHGRWEIDDQSLPFLSPAQGSANGSTCVADPNEVSLRTWLTQNHMLHNNKAREITYLNIAEDTEESKFISAPKSLEIEFLRRYSSNDNSSWSLAEYASLHMFSFFCDIDQAYSSPSEAIDILSVASNLAAVLGRTWGGSRLSIVIVTGTLLEEKGSRAEAFRLGAICIAQFPGMKL
jgi:hypothetical protein